ncbi:hypothetical protein K0M31_008368 [Melipona bicolor]|uniref:Uncharacterized protein n=1 Tax=Melipona bicolor TaxID=60889 RepID=A0AA40KKD6_9HYME|nr:hypothetical protein K0M31_008368 [Melipona bicolor]
MRRWRPEVEYIVGISDKAEAVVEFTLLDRDSFKHEYSRVNRAREKVVSNSEFTSRISKHYSKSFGIDDVREGARQENLLTRALDSAANQGKHDSKHCGELVKESQTSRVGLLQLKHRSV